MVSLPQGPGKCERTDEKARQLSDVISFYTEEKIANDIIYLCDACCESFIYLNPIQCKIVNKYKDVSPDEIDNDFIKNNINFLNSIRWES